MHGPAKQRSRAHTHRWKPNHLPGFVTQIPSNTTTGQAGREEHPARTTPTHTPPPSRFKAFPAAPRGFPPFPCKAETKPLLSPPCLTRNQQGLKSSGAVQLTNTYARTHTHKQLPPPTRCRAMEAHTAQESTATSRRHGERSPAGRCLPRASKPTGRLPPRAKHPPEIPRAAADSCLRGSGDILRALPRAGRPQARHGAAFRARKAQRAPGGAAGAVRAVPRERSL